VTQRRTAQYPRNIRVKCEQPVRFQRTSQGSAVNVTEGLLYIDAVRSLSEPTFIVTSDGMLSDANFAGLKMVGLTTVGHNVCLSSLVDNDTVEVMEFLHFWAGSRSSIRGNMVWRTPNGPQARELTAWRATALRVGPCLGSHSMRFEV
jgi:hypothetical protein